MKGIMDLTGEIINAKTKIKIAELDYKMTNNLVMLSSRLSNVYMNCTDPATKEALLTPMQLIDEIIDQKKQILDYEKTILSLKLK